jgi:hypothetical protein
MFIILMVNQNMQLQLMYFGISLFSTFCIMTNLFIINCSYIVGLMCLIDFYFIKNKDMILHHTLVMCGLHYLNTHNDLKQKDEILSVLLSSEISTIFLTMNNLLDNKVIIKNINKVIIKNINKCLFVSTFFYYRIYNYSYYLIFNKQIYIIFNKYSKNNFEFFEIYIGIYGMFILNLYWSSLILNKIIFKNLNQIKKE